MILADWLALIWLSSTLALVFLNLTLIRDNKKLRLANK